MNELRERMRRRYFIQQLIKEIRPHLKPIEAKEFDELIAKELLNASIKTKEETIDKDDYVFQGQRIPLPCIIIEVLYDILKRYQEIEDITLKMRDGKGLILHWE